MMDDVNLLVTLTRYLNYFRRDVHGILEGDPDSVFGSVRFRTSAIAGKSAI